MNYNNAIKDAQLQNNAALAEIAYNALQQQLELSLQGFQYKNNLILEQANKKTELSNTYWQRQQDILNQINKENEMAESVRQYEDNKKWQTEQNELNRQFEAQQAELQREYDSKQAEIERDFKAKQAELDRQHDKAMLEAQTAKEKELLKIQHQNDLAKLKQQQEYQMAQLSKQLENKKALLISNSAPITPNTGRGYSQDRITAAENSNRNKNLNQNINSKLQNAPTSTKTAAQKYGTFSNGYQPKGIEGHGTLKTTGDKVIVNGNKQNVWKSESGVLWYWDGKAMEYKRFVIDSNSSKTKSSRSKGV